MAISRAEFEELKDVVAELQNDRVLICQTMMHQMTHGDRIRVMGDFCRHCGSDDPTCRCWDDS